MPRRDNTTARGAPLVERDAELTVIEDALARSSAGGVLIAIEGQVGVGKTALLSGARELAQSAGMGAMWVRGSELERELPLGVVRRLLGPALGQPRAGAPPLPHPALARPINASSDFDVLRGLHGLVIKLAERRPLLLAIDDAHWADEKSLCFLRYLAARLEGLAVTILVASRPDEPRAPAALLAALARDAGRGQLVLQDLSSRAVERVVRRFRTDARPGFCSACAETTGGNPWLLTELLRMPGVVEAAATAEGTEHVRRAAPPTVRRTALDQFARWSGDSLPLLQAVAVLGTQAHIRNTAGLAGLTLDSASAEVTRLARMGILRDAEPLRFRYPMLREAVYEDLGKARREQLHGRAARLLHRDGAISLEPLANQLLAARCDADPWVAEALRGAADSALEHGAPEAAAAYLRRALEEPPPGQVRAEILAELGRAELASGAPGGAGRLAQAIDLSTDARSRTRLLRELGVHLYTSGHPADALAAFGRGLDEIDGTDPALRASVETLWLMVARLDPSRCHEALERIAPTLSPPPAGATNPERLRLATAAAHLVLASEPRERALDLVERATAGDALMREETTVGVAWIIVLAVLGWSDASEPYERVARAAIRDLRRRGSAAAYSAARCALGFHAFEIGLLQQAREEAERVIESSGQTSAPISFAARVLLARILIEADDVNTADGLLELVVGDPVWGDTALGGLALEARARLRVVQGKTALALEDALAAGATMEAALVHNPSVCPWRSHAAIAAAQQGEADRAGELAGVELRWARRFGAPRAIGVALRAAGLVRHGDGAIDLLRESAAVLESSPASLEHAHSLVELGAALRRRRRRAEARVPLRRGLDVAVRLGAAALERRARDELAASGARPRRRELSGVDSLTPGERRVVEMVAADMTNREIARALFVTVKAVQWHLHNAYAKLDVRSRDGLASALASHDREEGRC